MERIVVREIEHPQLMNSELLDKFCSIPVLSENDPKNPEWIETPIVEADLSKFGYDCLVFIKNEADKNSNPTGTIKDRAAWEAATLYRDFGLRLHKYKQASDASINNNIVPRLTIISAGNFGFSFAKMFEKYGLPPVKLLLDWSISKEIVEKLKTTNTEIYLADLKKEALNPEKIKQLTNNKNGIEITSIMAIEPQAIFYDWHVHESFNFKPNEIYVPYGSGRLMENYLTWQYRTARGSINLYNDPRLKVPAEEVSSINILGAEPENTNSIAEKLTKSFNPFALFKDQDISALSQLLYTGPSTGVYKVSEGKILEAFSIMNHFVDAEYSACAPLALFLQRYEERKIDPRKKVLIINTGNGHLNS